MEDIVFTYDDSMIFLFGICCFIVGISIMFAIHRVIFDYYDADAREEISRLKTENIELRAEIEEQKRTLNKINIEVQEIHTFATPADVVDLKFLEN